MAAGITPMRASQMLQALLGKGRRPIAEPPPPEADVCDVSVFAPALVAPVTSAMVQVMLHIAGDDEQPARRASLIDDAATLRGSSILEMNLPRGRRASIMLFEPALEIVNPVQTVTWNGDLATANFIVKAPAKKVDLYPTVHVSVDGATIGTVYFKLRVVSETSERVEPGNAAKPLSGRQYRRVFFSYSSKDRQRALEVAQSYRLAGITFFQDILSLEPGQRWDQGLYKEIDECDLFLLFWSEAARQSEWVAKEARYALDRQKQRADGAPTLLPLILEGPPMPDPPDFLAHLHFNDWMRFAISALSPATQGASGVRC